MSLTAVQLNVGFVDTLVAPLLGAVSVGADGRSPEVVVKLKRTDQLPPSVLPSACTCHVYVVFGLSAVLVLKLFVLAVALMTHEAPQLVLSGSADRSAAFVATWIR